MSKIAKAAESLQKAIQGVKDAQGRPLAKNEIETVVSSNGSFSIEFGEDVPTDLRKNAVKWLSDKGFSLTEDKGKALSFIKSGVSCVDCKKEPKHLHCVARKRWAV